MSSDWLLSADLTTVLARYNAEVARGLVHTEEWHTKMADLQEQFDEQQRARFVEQGMEEVRPGVWMGGDSRMPWWQRLRYWRNP